MPKSPGSRGNRCVRGDKDTGIGVSEAMKMHLWKAMFCQEFRKPCRDDIRVHGLPIPLGKEHVIIYHFAIFQRDLAYPCLTDLKDAGQHGMIVQDAVVVQLPALLAMLHEHF